MQATYLAHTFIHDPQKNELISEKYQFSCVHFSKCQVHQRRDCVVSYDGALLWPEIACMLSSTRIHCSPFIECNMYFVMWNNVYIWYSPGTLVAWPLVSHAHAHAHAIILDFHTWPILIMWDLAQYWERTSSSRLEIAIGLSFELVHHFAELFAATIFHSYFCLTLPREMMWFFTWKVEHGYYYGYPMTRFVNKSFGR